MGTILYDFFCPATSASFVLGVSFSSVSGLIAEDKALGTGTSDLKALLSIHSIPPVLNIPQAGICGRGGDGEAQHRTENLPPRVGREESHGRCGAEWLE